MVRRNKLNKKTRKELMDLYSTDPEVLLIQDKYSKKSLNPINFIKNKFEKDRELDLLLIKKEQERKEEEARIRREKRKAKLKRYAPIYILVFAIIVAGNFASKIIDNYYSTIREIHFINTNEVQYLGDVFKYEYEVIPDTSKFVTDDIEIVYSDNNLVNEENVFVKEGTLKATIKYMNKEYDSMYITIMPVNVTNIVQDDINVGIGNKFKLDPQIEPKNASNKKYALSDFDGNIISVEDNEIEGLELGTTKLTFAFADGYKKVISINVIEIPPSRIIMNDISSTYEVGDTDLIILDFEPKETTEKTVKFWSSDRNVVDIDQDGNIEAVDAGEAVIVAAYDENVKCEKKIIVEYPRCESISLDSDYYSLYVGNSTRLYCSFTPYNNRDRESLIYTSSNSSVLEVDNNGVVEAKSIGKARITAKCGNCTDSIDMSVIERPVERINTTNDYESSSTSGHIEGDGTVVYITRSGKKYHKDHSCPASDSVYSTSLDKLPSRIIGPCEKCWR